MYIVKLQLSLSYKAPPTKAPPTKTTPLIRPDVRGTEITKILLNSPKEKSQNFEGKNIQSLYMCQLDSIKFNLQYMYLRKKYFFYLPNGPKFRLCPKGVAILVKRDQKTFGTGPSKELPSYM